MIVRVACRILFLGTVLRLVALHVVDTRRVSSTGVPKVGVNVKCSLFNLQGFP